MSTFPTSKPIILCIETDEAILCYEKALLERSGYIVLTAQSAHHGLRLLTMCKCDAVLLDCDMPVTDVYKVAFEIRRVIPDLIIIMISGGEVPIQALALADAFVPKLEPYRQLLPMIAELCTRPDDTRQKQDHLGAMVSNGFSELSPRGFFEYAPSGLQSPREREEDS
jgi:CheY-like chemotaxis protein